MTGYTYRGNVSEVRTVSPLDFHRMTPKQRKDLAARRAREVGAARRAHVKRAVLSGSERRAQGEALVALIAVVASLMPITPYDPCNAPDCDLVARSRGWCDKHYRWIRAAERRAAA